MHLLRIVLLVVASHETSNATCPLQFTAVTTDVCATRVGQSQSFCGAATQCAQLGKNINATVFLIGRNAPKLAVKGLSHWTGVNQLLVYRNDMKTGWYDTNPNTPQYTTGSDFQWQGTQPEGYEAVTYYAQSIGKFGDFPIATGYDPLPVFCEYGGPLATVSKSIKFRSDFPVLLANFVQQNPLFYGCFSEILPSVTPIQCAFA
ncbi:hypothetical protein EG68_12030 [Paragonimus skrjabini miyazakii]|uniref:C-type lectin n=1 Tax=Paragonimus skrjabini miyazakii TaxID=59628 RepID=A0A8S9YHL9_9TREM|nr:hypothetical protein EG68_12030 [Paragonimus skrjabini miyazakii]